MSGASPRLAALHRSFLRSGAVGLRPSMALGSLKARSTPFGLLPVGGRRHNHPWRKSHGNHESPPRPALTASSPPPDPDDRVRVGGRRRGPRRRRHGADGARAVAPHLAMCALSRATGPGWRNNATSRSSVSVIRLTATCGPGNETGSRAPARSPRTGDLAHGSGAGPTIDTRKRILQCGMSYIPDRSPHDRVCAAAPNSACRQQSSSHVSDCCF